MTTVTPSFRSMTVAMMSHSQFCHRHPETAYEEHRTSALVATELERLGIEVHRGLGTTGLVGVLRAGTANRAVGLRADMDALNLTELNDFDYCSVNEGKMHACGHDAHTAMLLTAAACVPEWWDGSVQRVQRSGGERER